jgi:hypothetical protein
VASAPPALPSIPPPAAAPALANDAIPPPPSGGPASEGSAQAVAVDPTQAAAAADAGAVTDTQNLFWLISAALLAIPLLIVMTLLATVLTRR